MNTSSKIHRLQFYILHILSTTSLAFGLWKLFFNSTTSIHLSIPQLIGDPIAFTYLPYWLGAGLVLGLLSASRSRLSNSTVLKLTVALLLNGLAIIVARHHAASYKQLLLAIGAFSTSLTLLAGNVYLAPPNRQQLEKYSSWLRQHASLLVFGLFTFIYAVFSLVRHYSFRSNAADLGVYDQTAYLLSHGLSPILTTHYSDIHAFAVHFEPFLYILSPLYWIHPNPIWLLLLQVVGVTSGILAIFKIAQHFNLPLRYPILLSLTYSTSIALQNGLNFDFHSAMLMPGILLWLFYLSLSRQYLKLLALALLFLLIKEDASLYLVFFGLYVAVKNRDWKWGAAVSAIGLVWLVVAVKLVIPSVNHGRILNLIFDRIGKNISEVLQTLFLNPLFALKVFFDPLDIKVPVIVITLAHAGLLWLWAPWELLLLLPMFGIRFFSSRIDIWTFSMYYAAPTIAVVVTSALVGINSLRTKQYNVGRFTIPGKHLALKFSLFAACFSVLFGLLGITNFHFSYPIVRTMADPSFYTQLVSENSQEIRESLKVIPADAKVCASQSYIPHISTREYIATFRNCDGRYDYFVVNTEINNWPSGDAELSNFFIRKLQDLSAHIIFSGQHTLIVTTNPNDQNPTVSISEPIQDWLQQNTTIKQDFHPLK